jgi:hypothetical protein
MMALTPVSLNSEIVRDNPDLVVHALVLTGGGADRELEEKNAFAAISALADIRLTVADLPDMVFGPQRSGYDQDDQLVAELIPAEFCDRLVLGYDILKAESDLSNPTLYLPIPSESAHQKARLLAECCRPQSGRGWFDDEAFLGLMRVRGVQCHARYAEAFTLERALSDAETDYSVN